MEASEETHRQGGARLSNQKEVRLICTKETFQPWPSTIVRWLDWEEDFAVARNSGWQDPPLSRQEWEQARAQGFAYAAAFKGDRIVAVAAVWRRSDYEWEVAAVGTNPEFRRHGHGRTVVSFVTAYILDSGRVATCGTRADNVAMIRTAESVGFQIVPYDSMTNT